jgi:hypothetical protein
MQRTIALAALACGLLTLSPRGARAQVAAGAACPSEIPSNSRDRRALAKDWFTRAEAAESGGDPITAVKSYQCSLRIVPHAFTAFNLGRLAERTGDLELALESFNTYLKLLPEAPDKAEIAGKVQALGQRISSLRAEQQPTPPTPPDTRPTSPLPDLRPAAPDTTLTQPAPPPSDGGNGLSPAVYAVGAAGVAALAGAIVLNLSARGKMSDCRRLAEDEATKAMALAACDDAKPRAYGSYALFGVAAAAAAADVVLILMNRRAGGDDHGPEARSPGRDRQFGVAPIPGGAVAGARFRF